MEAIDALSHVLTYQPTNVDALKFRAGCYFKEGMLEACISDYDRCIELYRRQMNAKALNGRTRGYMEVDEYDQEVAEVGLRVGMEGGRMGSKDSNQRPSSRASLPARLGSSSPPVLESASSKETIHAAQHTVANEYGVRFPDPMVYALRGVAHLEMNRPQIALQDFHATVLMAPNVADSW